MQKIHYNYIRTWREYTPRVRCCVVVWTQDNEADAVWARVRLSAYEGPSVNNAADFHVDDALDEMILIVTRHTELSECFSCDLLRPMSL